MARTDALEMRISVDPGPTSDAREREEQTRALRREIAGLPVESVDFVPGGPAPAGTRSPEILMAGTLAVAILPSLLPKLIEVINGWLSRGKDRDVEITIKKGDEALTVKVPASAKREEVLGFVDELRARLDAPGKSPSA